MNQNKPFLLGAGILMFGVVAVLLTSIMPRPGDAAPQATPTTDKQPVTEMQLPEGREAATFAGGCFWSMEAMFKQLKGVDSAEPGYAGGTVADPGYKRVGSGQTGHAETINVIFDPKVVSYADLLKVFFSVHNPTTLNRQGADVGTQYRSIVFYHSPAQQKAVQEAIQQTEVAKIWDGKIVTEVVPFTNFYRAEEYHLDYYNRNPNASYCRIVIAPKIEKFHKKFGDKLKK